MMAPAKTKTQALTQGRVKEVLSYDAETGLLIWLVSNSNRVRVGAVAGSRDKRGYIWIAIDNVHYLAHRLAWLWMTGSMPVEIDHRDTDKSNNKWTNLREATRSQNNVNADALATSLTGHRGVTFIKENKLRPYAAYGYRDGKRHFFGYHATIEGACAARLDGAKSLYGEFARG